MATLVEEAPVKHAPPPCRRLPSSKSPGMSEDWLALCIGLFVFVLSLGLLFGKDILGWAVTTSVWTIPAKAMAPTSKTYATLPPLVSLVATYVFMLVVMSAGAKLLRANIKRFASGFTVVFALSYLCWFLGSWAYIAATPDKRAAFKIGGRST